MSTPQLGARVRSVRGTTVVLQVLVISEDSALPDARDVDLFVRLLTDEEPIFFNPGRKAAERQVPTPVARAIKKVRGDLFDSEWMAAHARDFISRVVRSKVRRRPSRFGALSSKTRRWSNEAKLPSAEFTLTLTDAAFASHLRKGDVWESTAYGDELWASAERDEEPVEVIDPATTQREFEARTANAEDRVKQIVKALRSSGLPCVGPDAWSQHTGVMELVGEAEALRRAIAATGVPVDASLERKLAKNGCVTLPSEGEYPQIIVRWIKPEHAATLRALGAAFRAAKLAFLGPGWSNFGEGSLCSVFWFKRQADHVEAEALARKVARQGKLKWKVDGYVVVIGGLPLRLRSDSLYPVERTRLEAATGRYQ